MRFLRLSSLCAAVLASSFASAFELMLDAAGKAVVLKAAQPSEVVRYTLNGKDPDFSAGVYLAPIELPEGGTVKAAAFEGNKRVGEVRTQVVPGPGPKNTALVPLTQNRDWKSYDWVTRHNEILALNQPGAMRADVVFLGDSITHFWSGEPKAKRVAGKDSWEKWIAPHHPINLGYGWDRTENVLWRLRHGEIAGLKPKAFVVLIGTNNLSGFNPPAETAEGVAEVCRELRRQAPQAKILLLAILPRQAKPDATRQRVTDTNKLLQAQMLLKSQGPQIADVYLDLTDKLVEADGSILKETMNDYLHPTNKGYEVMGAAIDAQLKAWSL
ncbi:MAG: GDSL-type esterase/lipase family protein [Opitutales bacterium]